MRARHPDRRTTPGHGNLLSRNIPPRVQTLADYVVNPRRKPRGAKNAAADASEDPIARLPSQSLVRWTFLPMATPKDSRGQCPYGDDVDDDDDDSGAGDAASPYDKGPAAIARWCACFRLVSR